MSDTSELIPVLSKEEIDLALSTMAAKISEDYKDKPLVLIGVLKGSFVFLADLIRKLSIPCMVDFISASSYGKNMTSSGFVRITKDIDLDLTGLHVLIVEDLVDTGLTLSYIMKHIENRGALSVKICSLIDKQERREKDILVDYTCHTIKEGFIVGYGIDYAEKYRHLPAIYHLKS